MSVHPVGLGCHRLSGVVSKTPHPRAARRGAQGVDHVLDSKLTPPNGRSSKASIARACGCLMSPRRHFATAPT